MSRSDLLRTGVLYCDDNLARLSSLPSESVDLIYLDPPFFSNRFYEVIWGDEAEVRSFEDRWDGGIQVYVDWMRHRVREMHRVLKRSGSIYLHCDPHASHYLKVLLDEIFGIGNFRNEIVWRRTGAHGKARRFSPIHDTILYYAKSNTATWNTIRRPYMRGHVEQNFIEDALGWRTNYYGNVLTGSGRRGGESGQPWRGYNPTAKERHWAIPGAIVEDCGEDFSGMTQHQKLDRLADLGYITFEPGAAWPGYEHRVTPQDGTPAPDIWAYQPYTEGTVFGTEAGVDADVRWLSPRDRERLGYPTQKPEALLERIIEASTNKGDVVLDPFCGCGTTVAVAQRMEREWVGIDISPTAVNLMYRRIYKLTDGNVRAHTEGLPTDELALRALKPFEFQNWVIQQFYGTASPRKSRDMGIDGFSFMVHDPIQVKQSEKVGRVTVDNFETAMKRNNSDRGYIVAFSFTRDAREEVARARIKEGLDIALVKVGDLLTAPAQKGDLYPVPATVSQMPLAPPRQPNLNPKPQELVDSVRRLA